MIFPVWRWFSRFPAQGKSSKLSSFHSRLSPLDRCIIGIWQNEVIPVQHIASAAPTLQLMNGLPYVAFYGGEWKLCFASPVPDLELTVNVEPSDIGINSLAPDAGTTPCYQDSTVTLTADALPSFMLSSLIRLRTAGGWITIVTGFGNIRDVGRSILSKTKQSGTLFKVASLHMKRYREKSLNRKMRVILHLVPLRIGKGMENQRIRQFLVQIM